ncbi:MAG TPA: lactate utilization protein [Candidatus Paceibacterota bacterium]|nr:lactate utilization protein [Candidatus Paceibacterota bacterium]
MDYTAIPSPEVVQKTAQALTANNFEPIIVSTKKEALAKIKELIPVGASVMNGASTTLEQIGYIEYLKSGQHGWDNLHEKILAEKDPAKQGLLRRQSVASDFYLGSAHALSQTGELVFGSNTGSQLPGLAFTAPNLILVVGTHKITPTLQDALARLNGYVTEREDERLMKAHGAHTIHAKTLILHKENPNLGRKVRIILVNEVLGF